MSGGGAFPLVDRDTIESLKRQAAVSDKRRARLNLHGDAGDPIQEMIIVFHGDCRMPPHRNRQRSESLHLIEGEMEVLVFDGDGGLIQRIAMAPVGSGKTFLYRMDEDLWHTMLPKSDFVVVHEIIRGPFEPGNTEAAPWAPADGADLNRYLEDVTR